MVKAVFSDVDGTLFNSKHELSFLNKYAINQLINQGIDFVTISGRSPSAIRIANRLGGFNSSIICYGGCLICDKDNNVVFNIGLDKQKANDVLNYVLGKYDNVTYCIYALDNWYSPNRKHPRIILEEEIVQYDAIEGDMEIVKEPFINKMLLICDKEDTNKIEEDLKNKYPEYSIVKSSDIQIEIMPLGINKGDAIKRYCLMNHIDLKDTLSFGDHFNDESMFLVTGNYFLMGNAPKLLKEKYPNITSSNNEDGFYHALVKIGLIKKID